MSESAHSQATVTPQFTAATFDAVYPIFEEKIVRGVKIRNEFLFIPMQHAASASEATYPDLVPEVLREGRGPNKLMVYNARLRDDDSPEVAVLPGANTAAFRELSPLSHQISNRVYIYL